MNTWLRTACERECARRALRVAALVGTILVVINYGDKLLSGQVGGADVLKMLLTYLVPYCVATYASVQTRLSSSAPADAPGGD